MSTLLKATDVAARWQCDRGTVYRLARCGALASVRIGAGGVRFTEDAVTEYEAAHTVATRPQTWQEAFNLLAQEWTYGPRS